MTRGSWVGRWILAALGVGVAVGSVASALALERGLREEVDAAAELGLRAPGLEDELHRSESPVRARLHLARALLAIGAAPEPSDGGPGESPDATEERLRRLEGADRLAREVLAEHPASWEAAAIAGAATYLRWSETRDPRLVQEHRRWERPLLFALEIAPVRQQPTRYLAAAYLELWPVLSEEKRALARELVETAFTDGKVFQQLLDPWLRVADGEAALEPIPDQAWAWSAVRGRAGQRADWEGYCEAWRRQRQALMRELRAGLAEAGELATTGELGEARKQLLALVAAAPVEGAFAPVVDGALRVLPHGPRAGRPWGPAQRWLAWAMAQELTGGERRLSVASLVRLRALAFPQGPGAPSAAALAAWVELARGRPGRAQEIEDRAEGPWRPEWAPYHLLEARFHLDQGRPAPARQALHQVHPDWRRHPAFLRVEARLAGSAANPASGASPDPAQAATALDWTYAGGIAHLAFESSRPAEAVQVTLTEVRPPGAALAMRWDGDVLGCRALAPATERLEMSLEAGPGIHELVLEPLAGGRVYPGTVELLPPPPPRRPG